MAYSEERDVENADMQCHAKGNSRHEEWVSPQGQDEKRLVLRKGVHGVEHFDDDENRQAHCRCRF